MIVAQNPTAGYALLRQARHNRLRPRIVAKFREQGNIGSEPRHRHCRVDRAAARVGRDLLCFGFAAFFQQQKGQIRIQHAHALDPGAVDDRYGVDRAAAEGENFHSIHPKPCLPQGAAAAIVPHNTAGPCTSMPGTPSVATSHCTINMELFRFGFVVPRRTLLTSGNNSSFVR